MKVFIGAVIITALLVAFMIVNMTEINSAIDALCDMISSIPLDIDDMSDDICDIANDISKFWSEIIEKIAFTTSYSDIDRADDAITDLTSNCRLGRYDEIVVSCQKALDALKRIKRLASITKESIF